MRRFGNSANSYTLLFMHLSSQAGRLALSSKPFSSKHPLVNFALRVMTALPADSHRTLPRAVSARALAANEDTSSMSSGMWMYRSEAFAEDLEGRSSRMASLEAPLPRKKARVAWALSITAVMLCVGVAAAIGLS